MTITKGVQMINQGTIQGKLVSLKTEETNYNNVPGIRMTATIRTAEGFEADIFYQANEKKSDGSASGVYPKLVTASATLNSIENVGEESADLVSAELVSVQDRGFLNDNGEEVFSQRVKGVFLNKVSGNADTCAIQLQGVIIAKEDVVINDVPTGEVQIQLLSNGYNDYKEVFEVTFPQDKADYVKINYNIGCMVTIGVKPKLKITQKVEKMSNVGFGEGVEEVREFRKLIMEGFTGSVPSSTLTPGEVITEAKSERLNRLKESKAKRDQNNASSAPTPQAAGFSL